MKKTFLFATCIISCCSSLSAQIHSLGWAHAFGDVYTDLATDVTTDSQGNVYTLGRFGGTIDFDPGTGVSSLTSDNTYALFLQKLDLNGNFVWVKSIGADYVVAPQAVVTDAAGNCYITGTFQASFDFDPGAGVTTLTSNGGNDCFLLKLDASGNFLWARSNGNTQDGSGQRLALDSGANVILSSGFNGTVDFDPGPGVSSISSAGNADVALQKFDADGNLIWVKSIGGSNYEFTGIIAIDAADQLYIAGFFGSLLDLDPGAATVYATPSGLSDTYLIKLDENGNYVWSKVFGGNQSDTPQELVIDAQGNCYLAGETQSPNADYDPNTDFVTVPLIGTRDVFLVKLTPSGTLSWVKTFGTTSEVTTARGLAPHSSGSIYLTGGFAGTMDADPNSGTSGLVSNGNYDIFVILLDGDGQYRWSESMGGTGSDNPDFSAAIAVDPFGDVYLAGNFDGTIDADPGTGVTGFLSNGVYDFFLQKLHYNGVSLNELHNESLTIYPNPAATTVTILRESAVPVNAFLLDVNGRTVKTVTCEGTQTVIDLEGLAPGMYVLEAGNVRKQVIKTN